MSVAMSDVEIPMDSIQCLPTCQCRVSLDSVAIEMMRQVWADNPGSNPYPPVDVFKDTHGRHILADGFHRYESARLAGRDSILCNIHHGGERDAWMYGLDHNAGHGVTLTDADKRMAIERIMHDEEWREWSDARIAELVRCGRRLVADVRGRLGGRVRARVGKDGVKRKFSGFGKGKPKKAKAKPATVEPSGDSAILDAAGNQVPKSLQADWEMSLWSQVESLKELASEIKRRVNARELKWLPAAEIVPKLQESSELLHTGRPFALCPWCSGRKCVRCRQVGWMPEDQYSMAVVKKGE